GHMANLFTNSTGTNGNLQLDIKGLEDVACDLVTGLATLKVELSFDHQFAKLTGQSLLDETQVRDLADELSQTEMPRLEEAQKNSASAAALAISLGQKLFPNQALKPNTDRSEKVVSYTARLSPLMVNDTTGDFVTLRQSEARQAVQRISDYRYLDGSFSEITVNFKLGADR
ncbi:MAG: hypothetical protein HRT45_12105, partial [Bdellovibrionales bacterium]|nr:hypothetical protein [Bdellovibrionales bacterium]